MEGTLFQNDLIIIEKLSYGARLPQKLTDIPLLGILHYLIFSPSGTINQPLRYSRTFSLGSIKLNDILISDGINSGNHIVKRCIGLPGNKLMIVNNKLYLNDRLQHESGLIKRSYKIVFKQKDQLYRLLSKRGLDKQDILKEEKESYNISTDEKTSIELKKEPEVVSLELNQSDTSDNTHLFGYPSYKFTRENFGPIIIPAKGKEISLNLKNLSLYEDAIVKYEGNTIKVLGNNILINDDVVSKYTFKMDYFFLVGDNRYKSTDSRYWGFVPEKFIIGKLLYVL